MRLTEPEFNQMMKNSHAKIRINARIPITNMEPGAGNESLAKEKAPRFNTPVNIHVHSYRYRLADADGICCKYAIDGLIHAGILADDSPKEVEKVSYSQTKIKRPAEEKTVIQIEQI